jgi:type II secretory pathway component PulK
MRQEPDHVNKRSPSSKGLVLVAVLWTVMLLLIMITTMGRTSRLDTKVSYLKVQWLRCRWACRAGLERALAILQEDARISDSLDELWSDNDDDFNNVALTSCRFSVRVVDEAGKLNVNTATREQLLALKDMTEEIADAILDWRDQDDEVREGGAERGYYENLTFGYTIRNGPLQTIRELLLVKGVTETLLYGEDTNFNGQLDLNERDGDQSPPWDDGDDELDVGWIGHLTCYAYDTNRDAWGAERINVNQADENQLQQRLQITAGQAKWIVENRGDSFKSLGDLYDEGGSSQRGSGDKQAQPLDRQTYLRILDKITLNSDQRQQGKVNVNTASEEVLSALLGGDSAADELARNIMNYRATLLGGLQGLGGLLDVPSMTMQSFKQIVDHITVRSNVYTVYSVARADTAQISAPIVRTEAVVDRGASPSEILYWYQGAGM